MSYVSSVEVVVGDSTNAIDGEDVNKGFGGLCSNDSTQELRLIHTDRASR